MDSKADAVCQHGNEGRNRTNFWQTLNDYCKQSSADGYPGADFVIKDFELNNCWLKSCRVTTMLPVSGTPIKTLCLCTIFSQVIERDISLCFTNLIRLNSNEIKLIAWPQKVVAGIKLIECATRSRSAHRSAQIAPQRSRSAQGSLT